MALQQDCEYVRDKADRIVRLILAKQAVKFFINNYEDTDFEMETTEKMRQEWDAKIVALQENIKAIVRGW